jgi:hypothetical protein
VFSNIAYSGGGVVVRDSGGELTGNSIFSNTAQYGGGVSLHESGATLSGNIIFANTAQHYGGGLDLNDSDDTLINNVVAENRTHGIGSGLYILASSPRLVHTTVAGNHGGDNSGIFVGEWESSYSTVALTNTVLVSHTVGISVNGGNTITLESTLWGSGAWANDTDWRGGGAIVTGTRNIWGDPAFASDGYHLTARSAAIDQGVETGVQTDIDGEARDDLPDLGADEFVHRVYLPLVMGRWPPLPYPPTLAEIDNTDGDRSYVVSWTEKPLQLAETYTLQEAKDAAFNARLREVCTTESNECSVTGRSTGTYYYRVRGHNEWGYGQYSNIVSVQVPPPVSDFEGRAPSWGYDAGSVVVSLSMSRGAEVIAVGTWLDGISVLDINGVLVWSDLDKPRGHYGKTEVLVSPDGALVVAAAEDDGYIYAYNRQGDRLWSHNSGHPEGNPVWGVEWWLLAMPQDGSMIVAATRGGYVVTLDRSGSRLWEWQTDADILSLDVSEDGSTIVVGTDDNTVYCFNRDGDTLWSYTVNFRVNSVALSEDGHLVVAFSDHIFAFDRTGTLRWEAPDPRGRLTSDHFNRLIDISSDGSLISVAMHQCDNGDCWAYFHGFDQDGDELWNTGPHHRVWPSWLRLAEDTHITAVGSSSEDLSGGQHLGHVPVFDAAGNLLWYFQRMDLPFQRIDISADGSTVVGGARGGANSGPVLAWGL